MHRNLANTHGIPTSKRKSSTRRLKTLSRFNARHFTETLARCSSLTYELPNYVDDDSAQIRFYRRANRRASPETMALCGKVEERGDFHAPVLPFVWATIGIIHSVRYVRSPREEDKLTRQRKDGRDGNWRVIARVLARAYVHVKFSPELLRLHEHNCSANARASRWMLKRIIWRTFDFFDHLHAKCAGYS